jgi:hypothetical protein
MCKHTSAVLRWLVPDTDHCRELGPSRTSRPPEAAGKVLTDGRGGVVMEAPLPASTPPAAARTSGLTADVPSWAGMQQVAVGYNNTPEVQPRMPGSCVPVVVPHPTPSVIGVVELE